MPLELYSHLHELLTVTLVAVFMAISPGSDFIVITRNSMLYGRKSGLYSAIGVSVAVWIHVAYSIAGLAVVISNSIVLFSIIKYLGAIYLIYIGWKTFTSKSIQIQSETKSSINISNFEAFKIGFLSNVLNPKTTIFFLSIFTQILQANTLLWIELIYGFIISLAHLVWFILVGFMFSHPVLLNRFDKSKKVIERITGSILILFGLKVAVATNE